MWTHAGIYPQANSNLLPKAIARHSVKRRIVVCCQSTDLAFVSERMYSDMVQASKPRHGLKGESLTCLFQNLRPGPQGLMSANVENPFLEYLRERRMHISPKIKDRVHRSILNIGRPAPNCFGGDCGWHGLLRLQSAFQHM